MESKPKRHLGNLVLRLLSALAALGLAYGCLRWDTVHASGWAWAGLIAAFSLLCLREFFRLAADCEIRPFRLLGFVCAPLWLLAEEWELSGGSRAYLEVSPSWLVFLFAGTAAMLLQLTRRTNDNALVNVAVTLLGIVYCAVLPGLSLHFRHMQLPVPGAEYGGWPMHGVEFAVVCIFITKISDVGALLVGSSWGRHKLIPRLSPGKTWEGAAGGLFASVFLLQFMVFTSPWMALAGLGRAKLVLLSILLAAAGLAGDLIESAFKRNSHRKDAGAGVPGFGGVLDLTDSLMAASPVFYFFLLLCGAEYAKATG